MICWPPDACAPLHDHGTAHGLARVVRGHLHEWRSTGHSNRGVTRIWLPDQVVELPAGVCHEVRNRTPEAAYSIHVYAPHLDSMTFYERGTSELRPIRREEARQW